MNMIKTTKMKKLKHILNEVLSEARFYVTYNKGRGQGKGLIRSVESDYEDARHWRSYNDAEKYVKMASKGTSQYGGRTSYWVSDINMNRIDRNYQIEEGKTPLTKIFDQGSLQDSMKQVRKLVGIEEADEKWPSDKKVEYDEFRFGSGEGGFAFKWEHGVKHFGRLGVSLNKDGNHRLYAVSYYDGKQFGDEKIDPKRLPTPNKDFLRHVRTWRDLDNLTMQTIITVLSKDVMKNEKDANKAFEQDRKAQQDFYSGGGKGYYKQKGRIGAGL